MTLTKSSAALCLGWLVLFVGHAVAGTTEADDNSSVEKPMEMPEGFQKCNETLHSEMEGTTDDHIEKRCHVVKSFAECMLNHSSFPVDRDFPFQEQKRIQYFVKHMEKKFAIHCKHSVIRIIRDHVGEEGMGGLLGMAQNVIGLSGCEESLKANMTEIMKEKMDDATAHEKKCMSMKMFATCLVKSSPFPMDNLPFEEIKVIQLRMKTMMTRHKLMCQHNIIELIQEHKGADEGYDVADAMEQVKGNIVGLSDCEDDLKANITALMDGEKMPEIDMKTKKCMKIKHFGTCLVRSSPFPFRDLPFEEMKMLQHKLKLVEMRHKLQCKHNIKELIQHLPEVLEDKVQKEEMYGAMSEVKGNIIGLGMCERSLKTNMTEIMNTKDVDHQLAKCMALKMFGTCLVKNSPFPIHDVPFDELKMLQAKVKAMEKKHMLQCKHSIRGIIKEHVEEGKMDDKMADGQPEMMGNIIGLAKCEEHLTTNKSRWTMYTSEEEKCHDLKAFGECLLENSPFSINNLPFEEHKMLQHKMKTMMMKHKLHCKHSMIDIIKEHVAMKEEKSDTAKEVMGNIIGLAKCEKHLEESKSSWTSYTKHETKCDGMKKFSECLLEHSPFSMNNLPFEELKMLQHKVKATMMKHKLHCNDSNIMYIIKNKKSNAQDSTDDSGPDMMGHIIGIAKCEQPLNANMTQMIQNRETDEKKCMAMKIFGTCILKHSPFPMDQLPFDELKMLQHKMKATMLKHKLHCKHSLMDIIKEHGGKDGTTGGEMKKNVMGAVECERTAMSSLGPYAMNEEKCGAVKMFASCLLDKSPFGLTDLPFEERKLIQGAVKHKIMEHKLQCEISMKDMVLKRMEEQGMVGGESRLSERVGGLRQCKEAMNVDLVESPYKSEEEKCQEMVNFADCLLRHSPFNFGDTLEKANIPFEEQKMIQGLVKATMLEHRTVSQKNCKVSVIDILHKAKGKEMGGGESKVSGITKCDEALMMGIESLKPYSQSDILSEERKCRVFRTFGVCLLNHSPFPMSADFNFQELKMLQNEVTMRVKKHGFKCKLDLMHTIREELGLPKLTTPGTNWGTIPGTNWGTTPGNNWGTSSGNTWANVKGFGYCTESMQRTMQQMGLGDPMRIQDTNGASMCFMLETFAKCLIDHVEYEKFWEHEDHIRTAVKEMQKQMNANCYIDVYDMWLDHSSSATTAQVTIGILAMGLASYLVMKF